MNYPRSRGLPETPSNEDDSMLPTTEINITGLRPKLSDRHPKMRAPPASARGFEVLSHSASWISIANPWIVHGRHMDNP